MSLFDDELPKLPTKTDTTLDRDSLDGRVTVFLNRWQWRDDRAIVRAELVALLALAQAQAK